MRAAPLVLAIAVAACAAEPPAAVPPPPVAGGEEASPQPSAECSAAAAAGELPTQPELPPAVAATRRALFTAATACDFAALDELAPDALKYSFGDDGEPIAYWQEAEARGEPVLRRLAEVLRTTPAEQDGRWVWPAFFLRPEGEWTAAERAEAERLLGDAREPVFDGEQYLGHRLAITTDGTWQYFIAGD